MLWNSIKKLINKLFSILLSIHIAFWLESSIELEFLDRLYLESFFGNAYKWVEFMNHY